jgi:hypothetical protein
MNIPKYDLTSTGFHYVLLDTPTQVHIILRKYIEYIQNKFKDLKWVPKDLPQEPTLVGAQVSLTILYQYTCNITTLTQVITRCQCQ